MNKSLILAALLAMSLVACSSKPVKETSAPVVEPTKTTQVEAPVAKDNSASTGTSTATEIAYNPLKDPNNILSKRSIYFDYDKDEVKAEFRPLVEAHAKYLLDHPNAKVFLQGNTDARGSREYNVSLGQRRSVAVKKVANLLGVQDKQIETVSYGKEKANATCADDTCYKQDRRVDIVYENE